MSGNQSPSGQSGAAAGASPGFRVCLTVSGLGCASKGAPLERALRRLEGVRDATVNALRDRMTIEVDRLPRLDPILRMLGGRGYTVDTGEVQVATWIAARPARLSQLRSELLEFPAVTYCRVAFPTGRLDFRLALGENWERDVRAVCTWLCETVEREMGGGSAAAEHPGRRSRLPGS